MDFVKREKTETLVQHLVRNASALNLTDLQRANLDTAFTLERGSEADQRMSRQIARSIQAELATSITDAVHAESAKDIASRIVELQERAHDLWAKLDAGEITSCEFLAAEEKISGKIKGLKEHPPSPTAKAVESFNDDGAIRIRSRDGLNALYLSGAITEQEFRVGVAYRLFFEAVGDGGMRSQLADPDRVRKTGLNGAPKAALFSAYVGVRLTLADTTLQKADVTGRMLKVVRSVAGHGNTITSLGKGGNVKAANIKALKAALRAAQPVLWHDNLLAILQQKRFAA